MKTEPALTVSTSVESRAWGSPLAICGGRSAGTNREAQMISGARALTRVRIPIGFVERLARYTVILVWAMCLSHTAWSQDRTASPDTLAARWTGYTLAALQIGGPDLPAELADPGFAGRRLSVGLMDSVTTPSLDFYERQGRMDEYNAIVSQLDTERREFLRSFPGLDESIVNAI